MGDMADDAIDQAMQSDEFWDRWFDYIAEETGYSGYRQVRLGWDAVPDKRAGPVCECPSVYAKEDRALVDFCPVHGIYG